jgi:protein-disulfide isomerase
VTNGIHAYLKPPVEAKGPSRGPDKAPVTVVLFADYQCPYCSRGADTLEEVRKKHPNDLRVVYRDYPLAFHEQAMPSAIVARCAGAQGKFWEMHDRLFAAQRELNESTYLRLASELKLDSAKLEKCRVDPAIAKAIKDDAAAGEAAGVDGTPAFFINGVKLTGAQPAEAFEAVIGPELARRAKK